MRKFFSISFVTLALVTVAVGVGAHALVAHAQAAAQTPITLSTNINSGYNSVMVWIMSLFAWLVGVAAITLDNAVYYTVIMMGAYVKNLTAVGVTWRILRDVSNIALIFGFIAIGISIILNTEKLGWGTKMLPMLLIAAVFLNFSLFISEAVIDAGNLFATEFYTQINGGVPAGAQSFTNIGNATSNGIAAKIMGQLGLQNIYGQATINTQIFQAANPWFIGFMGILLFLVTAFVMFSLAFILIARFIALIFLIIVAPIGFAGLAIPMLSGTAKKWWSQLFEQTITAPVLLLMLYIALAVITDVNFLKGFGVATNSGSVSSNFWTGFANNANLTGFASMMLSFIVAMGLLLAVVMYAKKIGAAGAGWATKWGGKLSFGATAFGMRSTVGAGSQYFSRKVRESRIGDTKTGRMLAGTLDRGAKASFDVRGATIGGGLKGLGVEAGAAQKGGYRARREKAIAGHEEYIKSVAKAIDERGATKADAAKLEERKTEARGVQEAAKNEYETAKAQTEQQRAEVGRLENAEAERVEKLKAEVARLEKVKEQEINFSPSRTVSVKTETELEAARNNLTVKNPEYEQKLETARQNLKTSEESLATASATFAKTGEQLAKTEKQTAEDITKERIKGVQLAYAENIKGVTSWAMFGPGGSTAAKKIIKEVGKSKEQKDVDTLMNLLKKNATTTENPNPPSSGGGTPHS